MIGHFLFVRKISFVLQLCPIIHFFFLSDSDVRREVQIGLIHGQVRMRHGPDRLPPQLYLLHHW